jgi:hypothetical protein
VVPQVLPDVLGVCHLGEEQAEGERGSALLVLGVPIEAWNADVQHEGLERCLE